MNWADQQYAIGRGIASIQGKNGFPTSYVRAVIEYRLDSLLLSATGSTFPNVGRSMLTDLSVPDHDVGTAVGIAQMLDTLDEQMWNLKDMNTTLESIAQAIFKSWFIDFDPVHAKAAGREPEGMDAETAALFPSEFEESELGPIPKGWIAGTLAGLVDLNPESWTRLNHPDSVNYVDLSSVKSNRIENVTRYAYDEAPSRARRVLRDGDTIFGTVRPGNRSYAFICEPEEQLTGSTGFAVLRPKEARNAQFVYLATTRPENVDRLSSLADGAAYPAVSSELILGTQAVIPPLEVLDRFSNFVSPLFRTQAANRRLAETLSALRDTLLPRLISGRLRIPEAEELVEEAVS